MDELFYATDISPLLTDGGLYRRAADAVRQRDPIDRIRAERERCLSLGGRLLLQRALRDAGAEPPLLAFAEQGKPYLRNRPDLHFNISHSGKYAVCVLSDAPVGCDVETIRQVRGNVAARCFSPEENAALAAADGDAARETLFYRLWTLKESYLKAVGCGITVPLASVSFDVSGGEPALLSTEGERRFFFREYGDLPGCRAALCRTKERPDAPPLRLLGITELLNENALSGGQE